VPILERGFNVSLEKIDSAEEIVAIGIGGNEMQSSPQVAPRSRITFLLDRHPSQFQMEPFVAGLEPRPGRKCALRIVPTAQPGQCRSVVEIEFSGRVRYRLSKGDNLQPALLVRKVAGSVGQGVIRCLGVSQQRKVEKKYEGND